MGHCHSKRAERDEQNLISDSVIPKSHGLGKPRVVFLSLYQLWQSWDDIPTDILLESIIVINGRRSHLFPVTNDEIRDARDWPLARLHFSQHFTQLLKCKDMQGLVIWMQESGEMDSGGMGRNLATLKENQSYSVMSQYGSGSNATLSTMSQIGGVATFDKSKVSPLWDAISQHLTSIVDPFTNEFYSRLTLCQQWWQLRDTTALHHCTDTKSICDELSMAKGNYKAMADIFKQSNPTLLPMITFDLNEYKSETIANHSRIESEFDDTPINISADQCDTTNVSVFGDIADENGFVWVDYNSDDN